MGRVIRMASRTGKELTAEYSDDEMTLMRALRDQLDGPDAAWARESMCAIHEIKALLGATITDVADGGGPGDETAVPEALDAHPPIPVTLDATASRAAKQEAMARVDDHADPEWKEAAFAAVERVARARETFTPDDIWVEVPKPREPRALGPVMLRARRAGICAPTGRHVKSRIPSQHQNPITEYRSLVHAAEGESLL